MKTSLMSMLLSALIFLCALSGCDNNTSKTASQPSQAVAPTSQQPPAPAALKGTVVETMNTGGYTYVQVDTGTEKIWAASNEFEVQLGDEVIVPPGVPMENYHSKTLDRTFELVYFVPQITRVGMAAPTGQPAAGQLPPEHPDIGPKKMDTAAPPAVDFSGLTKIEGGKSVAEIFSEKADLSGEKVMVRGKVVKFSPAIMGKNWVHLQDGTGTEGQNDLTITTDGTAEPGDTVVVKGVVVLDKDYGYNYKYDVILEDASITVE